MVGPMNRAVGWLIGAYLFVLWGELLLWDTDGFLILYKRLERGTFRFPAPGEPGATSVSIKAADLIMLLDGVDPQSIKRLPRYVRETA